MPDDPQLRPATAEEIAERCPSRSAMTAAGGGRTADDAMARITAERLVEHLERSGFVLMKRPPARAPG